MRPLCEFRTQIRQNGPCVSVKTFLPCCGRPYPRVKVAFAGYDRPTAVARRPPNGKIQFVRITLRCANSLAQILRDFFPAAKDSLRVDIWSCHRPRSSGWVRTCNPLDKNSQKMFTSDDPTVVRPRVTLAMSVRICARKCQGSTSGGNRDTNNARSQPHCVHGCTFPFEPTPRPQF